MVVTVVSVRDLHEQTEPIVRRVSEHGETIDIVDRGRVLARLTPPRPVPPEQLAAIRAERQRLAEEIAAHWPEDVSVDDAIRDIRREL